MITKPIIHPKKPGTMTKRSVFCMATTRDQALQIIDHLKSANLSTTDISALFDDGCTSHDFAHEKSTKSLEGAVTGATTGSVLGIVLGLIAGIGALAILAIGPNISLGPIMATLSVAAIGATMGGLAGGLIGLGVHEIEAKRHEGRLNEGNILLSVYTNNQEETMRAKGIFTNAGAHDIYDICSSCESITLDEHAVKKSGEWHAPGRAGFQADTTERNLSTQRLRSDDVRAMTHTLRMT